MKQITVLSGKGGTGKTSLVASFAALTKRMVVTDCDVDAPDLHLLLQPTIMEKQEFWGSQLATINHTKCTQCCQCVHACKFQAIKDFTVDPIFCEGCGVCGVVCPVEAIDFTPRMCGYAFISKTKYGLMSHARLNPGEENSGKLVTLVRQNAQQIADRAKYELILNDGPPGIGCPVIAALGGVDEGLIVVEPSYSSIHDMERALALLNHFEISSLICINKYDINRDNTSSIISVCEANDVKVVGKIPFDPVVTKAMVAGQPIVEYAPDSSISKAITEVWTQTLEYMTS